MPESEQPPQRRLFRVELKVGKDEVVLPLYATALESDAACKGHLLFTPETPLRYKYEDGVSFIAQKMSVPSSEIAGWQEGVLVVHPSKEPTLPTPVVEPEVPRQSGGRLSRSKKKPSG